MSYDASAIRQANADRSAAEVGGLFAQPLLSHTSDPLTSKLAADAAHSTAKTNRSLIYGWLFARGELGATADETDAAFSWVHLTAARRLTELEKAGLVVCRGDTRPSNTGNQARIYRRSHAS